MEGRHSEPNTAPSNRLSGRATSVRHFLVMEILERARAMDAAGGDVVHLEVGEPDFATPASAVEAGVSALRSGRTHYTESLGIPALREAISTRLSSTSGADIPPERVVVTVGSSAALLLAFAALADAGDEVVVADPGYPCYANIARALGIGVRPVGVDAASAFTYDPDRVAAAVTSRTRAIVVNSPSNPTGAVTDRATLEGLAGIGLPLVSDEIYAGLVYDGDAPSVLSVQPDTSFVVGGFSKRYAMTGWRLGFLVAPPHAVRAVQAMQQNLFISPSDFTQSAALAALDAHDDVEAMRRRFDERRRYLVDALPRIGLEVPVVPRGAFYVFADASRYSRDSMSLAIDVLERARVATAPGIDFGAAGEGYLRLSYATSLERIREGVTRLEGYFAGR